MQLSGSVTLNVSKYYILILTKEKISTDCGSVVSIIPGPRCIKLTINGKLDFNGNFHRILDADWLWCLVAMVVTIESKVTINGMFHATGPWCWCLPYRHQHQEMLTTFQQSNCD